MRIRVLVIASLLGALCVAGAAAAQPTNEAVTKADALFREGRALLDRGEFAEACPKFEESQRLDPGLGTLLNLADCYERTDRLASALTAFSAAEQQARALGEKKREVAAGDRARSLENRVSRLTITLLSGDRPAGFAVTRNRVAVPAVDFGRPIAVDPGTIVIEATAPDHRPWKSTVEITAARATPQIDIPVLEPIAATRPPTGTDPRPIATTRTIDAGKGRRRLGLIVGGVGVAGLGAGVVIGVLAKGKYDDAIDAHCPGSPPVCDATGLAEVDDARSQGTLGTIVGGVGVAAIAAGAVLWLTAPGARTVEITPAASADGAGVTVSGRF